MTVAFSRAVSIGLSRAETVALSRAETVALSRGTALIFARTASTGVTGSPSIRDARAPVVPPAAKVVGALAVATGAPTATVITAVAVARPTARRLVICPAAGRFVPVPAVLAERFARAAS
ncbi:MAG: hypothetical protein ACRDQB_16330 [Thermocrispum sp.]